MESLEHKRLQVLPVDEDCFLNQSLKASKHDLEFKKIEFKANVANTREDKVAIKKGFLFESLRLKKHENIF